MYFEWLLYAIDTQEGYDLVKKNLKDRGMNLWKSRMIEILARKFMNNVS
jgi:hypothetical protein